MQNAMVANCRTPVTYCIKHGAKVGPEAKAAGQVLYVT